MNHSVKVFKQVNKYLKDQKWNVLNYFLVEKSCRGRYGILIDSREAICQHSGVHVLEE